MEPDAATLANGTRFEDRYEILGELGSGSFARVYRARQRSTGQSVAIKLLSPREGTESSTGREVERFRRETQICAALHHINIVRLIDSGETKDGQLYAVFEHVPGETLTQTREFLGTPLYAAPEQLAGETPAPAPDLSALPAHAQTTVLDRIPKRGTTSQRLRSRRPMDTAADPLRGPANAPARPRCP